MSEHFSKRKKKDEKAKGKDAQKKLNTPTRRKVCRFCVNKEIRIDFKDAKFLQSFVSERGRILPRRFTGNCAKHQREVTNAIKRSRILAFMPFSASQLPLSI